ncbi:MAG: peptide-methionine (S)-S-oxide reductase MsrA [Saprospiraceae bacterium]|nr:peptide-methionine (S)-S-oxide reductase MsrA [Saprospiraceae bacterium]
MIQNDTDQTIENDDQQIQETATLGAGCFWCVEAVFQELKGVEKVVSGYSGGNVENPSYRAICTGTTGHAEVCQIHFNPKIISFEEILEVFWTTHDPTTLNRQGADAGTQYRSVIFYHNSRQKELAEKSKAQVAPALWDDPIVTEISPFTKFYEAEDYHQNYYSENGTAPYCQIVIAPKIKKFREKFKTKLKK